MKNESVTNTIFQIKDENGNVKECEILFTFASAQTNKNYLVYTDNEVDETGAIKVYANTYDQTGTVKQLMALETEEEWNTVEAILAKLEEKSE